MNSYYYDGSVYGSIEKLMTAVKQDIDLNLGDSDLDRFLKSTGGVCVDGTELVTSISIKRHDSGLYREKREEFVDWIVSEVREGVETGFFPLQVPYTYGIIECSE